MPTASHHHHAPPSPVVVGNTNTEPHQNTCRWDAATIVLATLGLMIAAAGGIGGGGILVPIYILVLRFSPKYAVPLSNITIFGGAITNTFLNMKKRHPLADRPLVDWDLILVMEPLTSELWCAAGVRGAIGGDGFASSKRLFCHIFLLPPPFPPTDCTPGSFT